MNSSKPILSAVKASEQDTPVKLHDATLAAVCVGFAVGVAVGATVTAGIGVGCSAPSTN